MNILSEATQCLDEFEAGRMSLPQLVVRLEALQSVADENSEEWHRKFFDEWMALEEINALLLDESRADKNLTSTERRIMEETVRGLRKVLSSAS